MPGNLNKTYRLKIYDIIKLFAIFLVIWGHALMHLQNYEFNIWENPLYRWISSFHMPLFMMISGFFSAKVSLNLKEYFIKKFHQLILPSLTFGVIFTLSWHFACGGGDFKTYVLCYWFLKSAFVCALLYYTAMHFKSRWIGFVLTVLLSQFIFLYQINWMYIPFIMGAYLYRSKEEFIERCLSIAVLSGIIYWIMLSFWNVEMASMGWFKLYKYILPSSLNDITYPLYCYSYKMLMGICGSLFFISLFILLGKRIPENAFGNLLASWGTLTLGIYLWQAVLLEHIMMRTINLSSMNYYLFNYVASPIISLFVLVICVVLTKLMMSNKWTSYIFLGKEKIKMTSVG